MKKKYIILSFDYELFFGVKSGSVLNTLINPTNIMLDFLDVIKWKATYFVDYLMIKKMRDTKMEETNNDLNLIETQLKDILKRGHRIELHLHPHWIDAKYNGDGTWDFQSFYHYSLSSLEEETIIDMFKEGCDYLNSLAQEIVPNYSVCAFRAGGWAIQPFNKIKRGFEETNIVVDSSVSWGTVGKNQYSYYDFRSSPDKIYYYFSEDPTVEDQSGHFCEVPISSYKRYFIYRLIDKIHRMISADLSVITDGTHKREDLQEKYLNFTRAKFTLSRISPISIFINSLLSSKEILVFIDHPKDFTYSSFKTLKLLSKYFTFTTYNKILNK